jgi:hypothetical protein
MVEHNSAGRTRTMSFLVEGTQTDDSVFQAHALAVAGV